MSIVIEMSSEREQSYRLSDKHRHRVMGRLCAPLLYACGGRTIEKGKETERDSERERPYRAHQKISNRFRG